MSVSRRKFIGSSAALSAALLLKPGALIMAHESKRSTKHSVPVERYSRAMFEPYLGDTFSVRVSEQSFDLKLVALTDLNSDTGRITTGKVRRTDCFALRFHAAKPLPAAATVHTLDHKSLGSFDLFMIQSEAGAGFLHTAVINNRV